MMRKIGSFGENSLYASGEKRRPKIGEKIAKASSPETIAPAPRKKPAKTPRLP